MIDIPENLRKGTYRFVRLEKETKRPVDKNWTTENNYAFDSPIIIDWIANGNNYGCCGGFGGLVILDLDNMDFVYEIEDLLPSTFTVETGSSKRHYYFEVDNPEKIILDKDGKHIGEIQGAGAQCVGPGSIHPVTKKEYKVINDIPIAKLDTPLINYIKENYSIMKNFETKSPMWNKYQTNSISDQIRLTDLIDTSKFKKTPAGELYGSHPIHGSSTGMNFFINPDKNLWHCFTGNQIIFTEAGMKKIKDVAVGEKIWGTNKRIQKVKTKFARKFTGKMYTIDTSYIHPAIRVTEGHPFLVGSLTYKHRRYYKDDLQNVKINWKNVENIVPGKDYLMIKKSFGNLNQIDMRPFKNKNHPSRVSDVLLLDKELGELIGWWLAEGSITKTSHGYPRINFTLSYYETENIKRLQYLLQKKLKVKATIRRYKDRGTSIIRIGCGPFARFLEHYFRKGAKNKQLGIFVNANRDFLDGLTQSYIKGDGHESVNKRSVSSVSEKLCREIQFVLLRLGYNYRMPTPRPAKQKFDKKRNVYYNSALTWRINYNKVKKQDKFFQNDEYMFLGINKITHRTCREMVYNLETEDHTYLLPFITHNCFRDMSGGDSLAWIAIQEGICQCHDFSDGGKKLRGKDFLDVIKIAKEKYNLKIDMDKVAKMPLKTWEDYQISPVLLDNLSLDGLELVYSEDVKNLNVPDVEWLVDEIIPINSFYVFAGRSGAYKTLSSLHMAFCISEGLPVYGKYKTKQMPVLYLNEENTWEIFKPMVENARNGLRTQGSKELSFSTFQNLSLDMVDVSGRAKLEKMIIKSGAKVIFFDSFKRYIRFDENDANKVNEFFNFILKPLRIKYGLTIIVLHHTKKENPNSKYTVDKKDLIRGSSDLVNIADGILFFEKGVRPLTYTLYQLKSRVSEEFDPKMIKIMYDKDGGFGFEELTSASKDVEKLATDACANEMFEHIMATSMGEFKAEVMHERYDAKYKKGPVTSALNKLQTQEILLKSSRGMLKVNKLHPTVQDYENGRIDLDKCQRLLDSENPD